MIIHSCNPVPGRRRQEDSLEFQASLGCNIIPTVSKKINNWYCFWYVSHQGYQWTAFWMQPVYPFIFDNFGCYKLPLLKSTTLISVIYLSWLNCFFSALVAVNLPSTKPHAFLYAHTYRHSILTYILSQLNRCTLCSHIVSYTDTPLSLSLHMLYLPSSFPFWLLNRNLVQARFNSRSNLIF